MLDDAQTELRGVILTIHDLLAEIAKLRAALEAIRDIDTDGPRESARTCGEFSA